MDFYFCRCILIIFMFAMAIDAFAQARDEKAPRKKCAGTRSIALRWN